MNTAHDSITMKDLPISEQPYEKCEQYGSRSLSDAELLAIIIRSGAKGKRALESAYSLLQLDPDHPGLEGLMRSDTDQIRRIRGIGRVKAIQLEAVFELSRRISACGLTPGLRFTGPRSAADYFMSRLRGLQQEEVHMISLDTKNQLIRERTVTRGTVDRSLISPREVYIHALRDGAVSIVLVHNHPSGDCTPSSQDLESTLQIAQAGQLLGIRLLDHIVVGEHCFTSLYEQGYLK